MAHAAEQKSVRIETLGERLGALRLCEPEAVASMRRSLERHGQLSAVAVFVADGGVETIDGFKRVRAARGLGWRELRAHVLEVDAVGAKLAISWLHDRSGLTEIEEAWLVRSLYREDQLSQPEIGVRLGRHKSWVSRRLLMAEGLDEAVQADVRLGLLTASAAAHLAQLQRCNQLPAARLVTRTGMTVRQTALLVADLLACGDDAARVRFIADRLEHPAPRATPSPSRRARTDAEWILADVAAIERAAGRLQGKLLGAPLTVLGPRVAQTTALALRNLLPVLDALGRTVRTVAATGGIS